MGVPGLLFFLRKCVPAAFLKTEIWKGQRVLIDVAPFFYGINLSLEDSSDGDMIGMSSTGKVFCSEYQFDLKSIARDLYSYTRDVVLERTQDVTEVTLIFDGEAPRMKHQEQTRRGAMSNLRVKVIRSILKNPKLKLIISSYYQEFLWSDKSSATVSMDIHPEFESDVKMIRYVKENEGFLAVSTDSDLVALAFFQQSILRVGIVQMGNRLRPPSLAIVDLDVLRANISQNHMMNLIIASGSDYHRSLCSVKKETFFPLIQWTTPAFVSLYYILLTETRMHKFPGRPSKNPKDMYNAFYAMTKDVEWVIDYYMTAEPDNGKDRLVVPGSPFYATIFENNKNCLIEHLAKIIARGGHGYYDPKAVEVHHEEFIVEDRGGSYEEWIVKLNPPLDFLSSVPSVPSVDTQV